MHETPPIISLPFKEYQLGSKKSARRLLADLEGFYHNPKIFLEMGEDEQVFARLETSVRKPEWMECRGMKGLFDNNWRELGVYRLVNELYLPLYTDKMPDQITIEQTPYMSGSSYFLIKTGRGMKSHAEAEVFYIPLPVLEEIRQKDSFRPKVTPTPDSAQKPSPTLADRIRDLFRPSLQLSAKMVYNR